MFLLSILLISNVGIVLCLGGLYEVIIYIGVVFVNNLTANMLLFVNSMNVCLCDFLTNMATPEKLSSHL